jgi:hypothetical protein
VYDTIIYCRLRKAGFLNDAEIVAAPEILIGLLSPFRRLRLILILLTKKTN